MKPTSPSTRRGFTLVELLVVIAIIGILVALLLPAVQAAREAARRSQCTNNQKQIALAMHNYHDIYKQFPAGQINCPGYPNVCAGGVNTGAANWLVGWSLEILPQMEQQNLYDQYNKNLNIIDAANQAVVQTFMEAYTCPSDVNVRKLQTPGSGPAPANGLGWAPGSYAAVSGLTEAAAANWDEGNPAPITNRGVLHIVYPTGFKNNGFQDVTDGTSNTILIGERHTKTQNDRRIFWADSYGGYNTGSIHKGSPLVFGLPDYIAAATFDTTGNDRKRTFAALHPGGVNFALVDGSVRFVAKTTDRTILWGVATIQGNESIQLP